MSNKPDLDELKLAPEIIELSKVVGKPVKFNEAGSFTYEKDFVEASALPDGVTAESIARHQKFIQNLSSAVALAGTHAGVSHFKKNKDAQNVELVMPIGKDRLAVSVTRSKTYPGRGENAEAIVKYGVVDVNYTVNGAVNSRGTMKKIRGYANELAAAELS